MVKTLLSLKEIPKPDDAADALAIALTHLQSKNFLAKIK
jgi:crossover junction endodeoxyribonuclease RuvC